jgi:hypothetical protein
MTDDRLPWETTPHVDHKAATERAIKAAQVRRVDTKSTAVTSYAQKAFETEIGLVKNESATRNHQLFKSAANLFELVAAGALSEYDVTAALRDACDYNGLTRDDGEHSVEATIRSGRRHGYDSPRDLSQVGKHKGHNGFTVENAPVHTVNLVDAFDLERGFWTSRESLKQIYLAALSRMCSPWSVLAFCAARALTLVPPRCVLPPIVGGKGSLNWICALTAKSAGGKSSSHAIARELIPAKIYTRNLGSGEGLVDSFYCKEDDDHPTGRRESVMFIADEIDNMTALAQRSGSTLMGTLRSAFSAEALGFSYRGNRNHLDEHDYRMTLVINVQPARAGSMFEDRHGGTLQRIMWFPATDPRVTTQTPLMPAPLTLPPLNSWQYDTELQVPYETIELIKDERARNSAGLTDDLAGHALFVREKFAYALTILDGRTKMSLEDWRLAGIASKISDHTREWVESELRTIQDDEDTERGRRQGVSQVAADEEKTHRSSQRQRRIANKVLEKVKNAGETGIARNELRHAIAHRDRPFVQAALDALRLDNLIQRIQDERVERWVIVSDE